MTNKANFSIVQSKKGTEIVLSGRKITKQSWIAAILILVAGTALFLLIHGKGIPDNISFTIFLFFFNGGNSNKSVDSLSLFRLVLPQRLSFGFIYPPSRGNPYLSLQCADTDVAISDYLPHSYHSPGNRTLPVWYAKRTFPHHGIGYDDVPYRF